MAPLLRYYHTIRHLRPRQVWYRLWRPFQKCFYKEKAVGDEVINAALAWRKQSLFSFEPHDIYEPASSTFSFLNLSSDYPAGIDWNDRRHGLLWAFHLNYFGWLEDERVPVGDRLKTIRDYVAAKSTIAVGLSSYTISLRSISWIRFFLKNGVGDDGAIKLLYQHLVRLRRFPEYELDGNHLWENGCALFAGGLYFKDDGLYKKGMAILQEVIRDQLAEDGMHLEASPMYHSLLLQRLVMCLELSKKLRPETATPRFLEDAAAKMLGWLIGFSFNNGSWAMVNDSTPGMAPSLNELVAFAGTIELNAMPLGVKCHYRAFKNESFELVLDAGNITPAWQPGHQHADVLNFCVQADDIPIIVDAGISTYDASPLRQFQRSTGAHNTINIDNTSSSDIWKSFRVGRRGRVKVLQENASSNSASHDGYRAFGIMHERNISFGVDKIIIEDQLKGFKRQKAFLHLHFHPDIEIKKIGESQYLARNLRLIFKNARSIGVESYTFAAGMNRAREATRLVIEVTAYISTTIERINTTNAD